MSFDRNDYLKWYVPRVMGDVGAVNLHASGVPALAPAQIPAHGGDPWSLPARFEAALAARMGRPAEELLFTPGATGGTLLALLSLAAPDQELIVEAPIYEPMLRQAERLGTVRRFRRRARDGWRLPLAEARALLSERTGLVLVTEPSNPSGTFAAREDLLALVDAAAAVGATVLVNEVYRGFRSADDTAHPSFLGARDNLVVVDSFSKLLGTYWARIGWLAGPAVLIGRLREGHRNMGIATSPAAALALGVLDRADEWRAEAVARAAGGRDAADAWVRATPGISWHPPEGPGFGCVRLPDALQDDVRFAERLQEQHGVLTVPGTHFEVPGSLRISWMQAGERLEEGLTRIGEALSS